MRLQNFAALFDTHSSRLMGKKGTKVLIGAGSLTGSFDTIFVGVTATISAVVGGGQDSQTWIGEIPAGTTLATEAGNPVTSITISAGTIAGY